MHENMNFENTEKRHPDYDLHLLLVLGIRMFTSRLKKISLATTTVQHRFLEFNREIRCVRVCNVRMLNK